MSIFNSLGSNYSSKFVMQSLFGFGSKSSNKKLEKLLNEHFGGTATLTYKGREALELALLKSKLPKDSSVAINGFTCYVVYEAIVKAGYKPVFVDLKPGTMHFDKPQLEEAYQKNPSITAVVIQNTLGYPVNIVEIDSFCKKNDLMIIEDLAHSFGTIYDDGREAGTVGEFSMFSFSQDKPLDVVAGGACINRIGEDKFNQLKGVSLRKTIINRTYPFWTSLIRSLYQTGLGRILHFALKKLHLMASPLGDGGNGIHKMSSSAASLLVSNWHHRHAELEHRKKIAKIYQTNLPEDMPLIKNIKGQPTYLRFPIKSNSRKPLIKYLASQSIYIGDTWYDAPISPKRYLAKTNYRAGECPESEKLSATILNLPTHRHITPHIANDICAKIKQWQALNQKT